MQRLNSDYQIDSMRLLYLNSADGLKLARTRLALIYLPRRRGIMKRTGKDYSRVQNKRAGKLFLERNELRLASFDL